MKKFLLLFVFFLVIEELLGQSYATKDSVSQLTVNETTIYQILDDVYEREKFQPYFTDTLLSIYMDVFFCSDSNCIEFGKIFVVDICFRETAAVYLEKPIGVFSYRGFNIFVNTYRAPFVVFRDLFPSHNYSHPELQSTVYWQKEFPRQFTMLKKNDSKTRRFNFFWNNELAIDVIYGGVYIFHRSRYIYDQDKFYFIDYKPIEKSTF